MITLQTAAASVGIGYEVAKKLCHAHGLGQYLGRSRVLDGDDLESLRDLARGRAKRGRPRRTPAELTEGRFNAE